MHCLKESIICAALATSPCHYKDIVVTSEILFPSCSEHTTGGRNDILTAAKGRQTCSTMTDRCRKPDLAQVIPLFAASLLLD
jgi:hypothetical protein